MSGLVVKDKNTALVLGIGCLVAGSWLLREAYEHRGQTAPWLLRWLPN